MSEVFLKHGSAPASAAAESAGLRWLREGSAAVVDVLDLDRAANTLVIEKVSHARPTHEAARQAGRELAKIHACGAAAFGAPPDGWDGPNFIGRIEQECRPTRRWAEFYAHQRVLPFAERARDAGNLSRAGWEAVRAACKALEDEDEDAPLARIHGDLWSGNLLFSPEGPRFIDPAAHGGHPLTDIAMLELFGAPHFDAIVEGYLEDGELGENWQARIPIHQLHPLAVHAFTHGPGYGGALVRAAEQTLEAVG
ncbi:fructosamine kinase family protein [Corynebacterium liangguodongii]|uniref:Fructosamine kinase n=1 Tax=Corynebacterium liangguodongii TaxID=2079535 RepID=A0A2S0WFN2_9CORY|nr:fructosamine kinase family protein [Corynebacterium liangguodongii]AWB84593.1 fructosamine kinase [Corynebacterium liangguodongii]PWB98822.1 fructosamine kinase [Corynebacterium liangguodongii]